MGVTGIECICAHREFARATEAEDGSVMNEIVVTATRREQTLNDVPIAVTAISRSQVTSEHIITFDDLLKHVPGINFIKLASRVIAPPTWPCPMAS